MVRREVEIEIPKEQFYTLAKMIPFPFVSKDFRVYQLTNDLELECSLVDEGTSSQFMYAEVEFPSVEAADHFTPLPFFKQEITENPAYRMKNYWQATRS